MSQPMDSLEEGSSSGQRDHRARWLVGDVAEKASAADINPGRLQRRVPGPREVAVHLSRMKRLSSNQRAGVHGLRGTNGRDMRTEEVGVQKLTRAVPALATGDVGVGVGRAAEDVGHDVGRAGDVPDVRRELGDV